MNQLSVKKINRFRVQGYTCTDQELAMHDKGIRFANYAFGSLVLIGLILQSVGTLTIAMIIAFFGSILQRHPFDYLYNNGVRQIFGKLEIPKRTPQGRFACVITTAFLVAIILSFKTGYIELAIWLGAILVFTILLVATSNICITSIIYNFIFRQKNKNSQSYQSSSQG